MFDPYLPKNALVKKMQIEYFHFSNTFKPVETLKAIKTLKELNHSLHKILIQELLLGNKIIDVSVGWPFEDTIDVSLRFPFFKNYKEEGVRWVPNDDLHYGGSKYLSNRPVHILSTSQNN